MKVSLCKSILKARGDHIDSFKVICTFSNENDQNNPLKRLEMFVPGPSPMCFIVDQGVDVRHEPEVWSKSHNMVGQN